MCGLELGVVQPQVGVTSGFLGEVGEASLEKGFLACRDSCFVEPVACRASVGFRV